MGNCCKSKRKVEEKSTNILDSFDDITKGIIKSSGINGSDLIEIYETWAENYIDKEKGVMDYDEFLDALQVNDNVIVKRIFEKCMLNPEGTTLTFGEFICTMWTLNTLPDSMAGSYLHFLYDSDGHGKMLLGDMDELVTDMKSFLDPSLVVLIRQITPRKPNLAEEARKLDEYDMKKKILHTVRHGTEVVRAELWPITACHKWSTFNPLVFVKFVDMIHHVTKHVFGEKFWKHMSEAREKCKDKGQVNFMLRKLTELHEKKQNGKKSAKKRKRKKPKIAPTAEVGDIIGEYKITQLDVQNAKLGIKYDDPKDSKPKHHKKIKTRVVAGFRRMSLTFGKDFNNDKERHRQQYEKDMERIGKYETKDTEKKSIRESVTGTVRRLSVSIRLKGKKKNKESRYLTGN